MGGKWINENDGNGTQVNMNVVKTRERESGCELWNVVLISWAEEEERKENGGHVSC